MQLQDLKDQYEHKKISSSAGHANAFCPNCKNEAVLASKYRQNIEHLQNHLEQVSPISEVPSIAPQGIANNSKPGTQTQGAAIHLPVPQPSRIQTNRRQFSAQISRPPTDWVPIIKSARFSKQKPLGSP